MGKSELNKASSEISESNNSKDIIINNLINITNSTGMTLLMKASEHGNIDFIKYLLGKNADVNVIGGQWNALMYCFYGKSATDIKLLVAELLCDAGIDINYAYGKKNILDVALMYHNDLKIIKFILDKKKYITCDALIEIGQYPNAVDVLELVTQYPVVEKEYTK